VDDDTQSLSVLVVRRGTLARELISVALAQAGLRVVATAGGPGEGVECYRRRRPDVVLVDASESEAVAAARAVAACDSPPVVAFDVPAESETRALELAEAGVRGFVMAEDSVSALIAAAESVAAGRVACPPQVAAALLGRVAAGGALSPSHPVLTERELEVIALICRGLSNKQIARELSIELPTVKNHVHHILKKLKLGTRAEAAIWARTSDGVARRPVQPAGGTSR
jgi:two-component system, NarL family, nitrate/nitrite response regulator NarL